MQDEAGGEEGGLQLRFPASPWEVRAALQEMLKRLPAEGLGPEVPSVLEIVMAEVMNNVVEHAYRGAPGVIELQVNMEPRGLRCHVMDHGEPMPEERLPEGRLPGPGFEGLPEGGFGWFLITTLAREIHYQREAEVNRLSFLLLSEAPAILPKG